MTKFWNRKEQSFQRTNLAVAVAWGMSNFAPQCLIAGS
jgi:hypothetical protein